MRSQSARTWITVTGVTVITLVAVATVLLVTLTRAWADGLHSQQRFLPGTSIQSVDVGGMTWDEAHPLVDEAARTAAERAVVVAYASERWEVSPRDLGATPDVDGSLAKTLSKTSSTPWWRLAQMRWFGDVSHDIPVDLGVYDWRIRNYVAEIAAEVDRPRRDASLDWTSDGLVLVSDSDGVTVSRRSAAALLRRAFDGEVDRVDLPVQTRAAILRADLVERVLPDIQRAVDAELDRTMYVVHGGSTWEVTPRELGAAPDVQTALAAGARAAALQREADRTWLQTLLQDVEVRVGAAPSEEKVHDLLAMIADEVDDPARDAYLDWSTGWVEVVPERSGEVLDWQTTADRLRRALKESEETVEVLLAEDHPKVTTEDYTRVLLVRQDLRSLFLYVEGEVAREWPVAVGMLNSSTPTGQFTIGAKRHMPTWYNPSPTGWGRDMPRVIGPGPSNPLGVRALNWNRHGRDTLIRFHGTPNTASIGQAASRGCVRLTNEDVVELFDLVPSGTAVVSIRG